MKRLSTLGVILFGLTLGCTQSKEIKPDANLTPKVDEAEIQKQIQEGMRKGGGKQPTYNPK